MKAFCHIYAQWDQIGSRISDEADHLLDLGLVCDATVNIDQASIQRPALCKVAERGGLCAPNIYPAALDATLRDANWWKYSPEECERLLGIAAERFKDLDLGPMVAVNTYTPGNSFVTACRKQGVRFILGFCAPTVIEDGGWEIAHYGSPLSPYFISDDDYRKPDGSDREDAVLMSSMELRNPMVCLDHWSEGPWCPLNAQAADRWLEPTSEPYPFFQIAEDWLRQSELSGRPLFFHINLQYFFAGRCFEHNRRALEWLAEQRDKGRLEIGGLREWASRLKSAGGFERQTSYWRGEMMGSHVGHRPGCFPEVMVDESLERQVIWQCPDPRPRRFYSYEFPWDYPAFLPDGTAPRSVAFEELGFKIVRQSDEGLRRSIVVEITNPGSPRRVPLAVWDQFRGLAGELRVERVTEGWEARVVPHPSGEGGALILEGKLDSGVCRVAVDVSGEQPAGSVSSRTWGRLLAAETFYRAGRPYTYVVAQTPDPFCVEMKIKRARYDREPVLSEHLCGLKYQRAELQAGSTSLQFDGSRLACWHRIWGVAADQIEIVGVEEAESRLRQEMATRIGELGGQEIIVGEPGYHLFGNIRDSSRWDRHLGRLAGEREIAKATRWFAERRSDSGPVVIEVHPGAYLPKGSITKVLGHEFDVVRTDEGYGFREVCVDYPQGWDWGIAAWVQWRQLKVVIEGLKPEIGSYHLHLHAFDPEHREICQRVHFFDPSAAASPKSSGVRRAELCGASDWELPSGIDNRWDQSALCSIEIPAECLTWPSIGIWIVPLERIRLYDWIAEKGAPGVLCHLWVTVKSR